MTQNHLPFEVGHTVEARSFEGGFRGAWFRCEITKISKKGRALYYHLKYLDYVEEEIHNTKVFQKPEYGDETYLMVRPPFPRQCREDEVHEKEGGLEEVLVVPDSWKVGDLVDWWKDDCYWSGTVLEVKENESVQIELLPEPYGEGGSYEAPFKDLRPSLEWSLEDGWIVPFSEEGEKRQCAELMKFSKEVDQVEGSETGEECLPCVTADQMEESETGEEYSPCVTAEQVEGSETREEEKQRPTEKLEGEGELALNIMESESSEAAVMDLEELIARIEWLKGMLPQDDGATCSEKSCWKYEDYRPSRDRL